MLVPIRRLRKRTRNSKRLVAALVIIGSVGGLLAYATTLPPRLAGHGGYLVTTQTSHEPQVEGAETGAGLIDYVEPGTSEPSNSTSTSSETLYKISGVIDGDTIKADINGKTQTIRLIGVDTPETVDPRKTVQCFGREASDFTKKFLQDKNVHLRADPTQTDKDKYGRLLRYVVMPDGTSFNLTLIESGYAFEYTYKVPYQYQKGFKSAQSTASAKQLGLWSPHTCNGKHD